MECVVWEEASSSSPANPTNFEAREEGTKRNFGRVEEVRGEGRTRTKAKRTCAPVKRPPFELCNEASPSFYSWEKSTIDGCIIYIYIFLVLVRVRASCILFFFLKLFKKDLYDSIDILFFFLSHFWSFFRIYIRFYILAIFYMFLVFLLSGCLRKVEFLRQEMGRFKQRFALLFYAFFVHSADFRVFNIFHECINMVRYVYYFI